MAFIYFFCFSIGFLAPIVFPLWSTKDITLKGDICTPKRNFLKSPSMALIDSIQANTLQCMCGAPDYDYFVYYWVVKDSFYYNYDNIERPMYQKVYKMLTDTSKYYSPNTEMIQLGKQLKELLQTKNVN